MPSGAVVAYIGNACMDRERPGMQVDVAASARSTGSILKPFLYAAALQEGVILPRTLLPDIPMNLGGFAPQNFDRQFYGAVPADEALARSLNVPAVYLLRQYGVPKFHALLQEAGLSTLSKAPEHYGLSLILGGAEARLDEVTAAYAGMVRFYQGQNEADSPLAGKGKTGTFARDWATWHTLDALKEVNRPDELDWRLIRSVRKAAWKTAPATASATPGPWA